MKDDNKQIVIERIWNDPAPVFGCDFREGTTYRPNIKGGDYDENGKIRLKRTPSGIFVYYNGGSRKSDDVFNYLMEYHLHTSDFWDTLQTCAERYGVRLELSEKQAEKIHRERLAREVAPSLCAALMDDHTGKAWAYLSQRGIEPDGVHFGELTPQSIQRAKDALSARGFAYSDDDFKALKLTPEQAATGYNVVLPYYLNGVVIGFLFRDVTGKAPHKYDTPQGMKRGYCDRLTHGEPAYIVEGEIDALRLMAAGYTNVIALGGATLSAELAGVLDTHEIHQIIYIPDLKFNEKGEKETDIIDKAIRAFQSATVNGERVITNLYVAEFPTPQGVTLSNYKTDADTYGNEQGADALRNVVANNIDWWGYELGAFEEWATNSDTIQRVEFERRFMDIYNRCATPIERERLRQYIDGYPQIYAEQGITRAALLDVDEMKRHTEYNDRVRAAASDLTRAVEQGANPAVIGDIVARLAATQSSDTRDEWDGQLSASYSDALRAIQEQPETVRTKWELGEIVKNKKNPAILDFHRAEYIEYYPATITVFCAPTSHGKTMILLQSALDLVRATDKTFLYVSCEENQRQLLERALNVYLDIPATETGEETIKTPEGKEIAQNYCFISGTRKRAIKAALRGGYYPDGYTPEMWQRLSARINEGVKRYGEQVHPRLKLIHTDGSAESIAANVKFFVERFRAQGVDVGGVFVDYMQLLTSDHKTTARNYELKDVCKALADCATDTELPIIVAAQLNRYSISEGVDAVTVANLGEGADIERIAHDIYFIWQVDKTKQDLYYTNAFPKGQDGKTDKTQEPTRILDYNKVGERSRRIFKKTGTEAIQLKTGHLYIEQLKARDGKTGGWGLFPFDGERGQIGTINDDIMKE